MAAQIKIPIIGTKGTQGVLNGLTRLGSFTRSTITPTQTTTNANKVLVLMVGFLFGGEELLKIIGLDVSSFAIAGSLVIFIIAMEMILGVKFFKEEVSSTASIVPLAFPLIAGAGTMTTLLSLKTQYQTSDILVGIVANTLFVYLVLKNVKWIEKLLGKTGLNILRKAFGIILLAIAIKLFRSNTHL